MRRGISVRISQYVKGSLWLLPLLGAVAGFVLAELFDWLDASTDLAVLTYSPGTATAVASATIGDAARRRP